MMHVLLFPAVSEIVPSVAQSYPQSDAAYPAEPVPLTECAPGETVYGWPGTLEIPSIKSGKSAGPFVPPLSLVILARTVSVAVVGRSFSVMTHVLDSPAAIVSEQPESVSEEISARRYWQRSAQGFPSSLLRSEKGRGDRWTERKAVIVRSAEALLPACDESNAITVLSGERVKVSG